MCYCAYKQYIKDTHRARLSR